MRDAVASPIPAAAAPGAAFSFFRVPVSPAAPITSTEWLERRGLLESLSVSEAAAFQDASSLSTPAVAPGRALGLAASSAPGSAVVPAPNLDPTAPVRASLAWWGLAFLPGALVLLKELL